MSDDDDDGDRFDLDEAMSESTSEASFLDDVLLEEGQEDAEGDGLELDDSQAGEIRRIFLTSLPQYVLPVEQLVEQLVSADTPNEEVRRTLLSTLASIAEAAERLGIDDARDCIERMHVHVETVGEGETLSDDLRTLITQDLDALKRVGLDDGAPSPSAPPTRTLVDAFRHVEDVDQSLLEQLTRAGLVTVDQLEQAEPAEIVAVTGLDAAVVDRLLRALTARSVPPSSRPPLDALADPSDAPRAPADSLEAELERRLRARVEAEASLEETRVHVQRIRSRAERLARELEIAVKRRERVARELLPLESRLSRALAARADSRAECDRARAERDELARTLETARQRIPHLSRQRRDAGHRHQDLSASIAELSTKAENLLRAARRAEAEQAIRASSKRSPIGKRGA